MLSFMNHTPLRASVSILTADLLMVMVNVPMEHFLK